MGALFMSHGLGVDGRTGLPPLGETSALAKKRERRRRARKRKQNRAKRARA